MADSVIGAIRVLLGMDTAAFSEGAKNAQSTLDGLTSAFKKAAAGLTIAFVANEFKKGVENILDEADKLNKASQKFGVPVETLSALKYAADLADVSFESLGKGLGKLSKAILDGAVNPSGEAAKSFKALGVSVKDANGNIRPTEEIFSDIAEKFSNVEDGAAKTALAIRVFGKSGADLIPLLNEGRGGIKAMADEARRFGIVISADTAKKAEEFNDTLKKISLTGQAFYLQVAEALLPTLQNLAQWFLDFKTKGGGDSVKNFFANLITETDKQQVITYTTYWENFVRVFTAAKNILAATVGTKKEWDAALAAGDKALKDNAESLARLNSGVAFLNPNLDIMAGKVGEVGEAGKKGRKGLDDFNTGALATKNAVEEFISSQKKSIAATNVQAQTLGGAVGFAERWKAVTEAYVIAEEKGVQVTPQLAAKISELGIDAQNAAIKLAGAQMTQENLTIWEQYAKQLDRINQLLAAQAINADTAKRATDKAAMGVQEKWTSAASTSAGQFADFFATVGKGNEEMWRISQAFAIAQALINTYQAATKSLAEWGMPWGAVFAAAAVAAGIAQVVKIASTKPAAKAAFGGSFRVPGGSMAVDTRLVPMALAPGERVDVTPANAARGGASSGVLQIPEINPQSFFTGDTVRYMVQSIDQWMRDGGTGVRMVPR